MKRNKQGAGWYHKAGERKTARQFGAGGSRHDWNKREKGCWGKISLVAYFFVACD